VNVELDHPEYLAGPLLVQLTYDDSGLSTETPMTVLHYDEVDGYESVTMHEHDVAANTLLFDSWSFSKFFPVIIDMTKVNPAGVDTGFRPAAHGWTITNAGGVGSPFSDGGNCLGMSAYASWFYEVYGRLGIRDFRTSFPAAIWPPVSPPLLPPIDPGIPQVSVADLLAVRAHQAVSQYWAWSETWYVRGLLQYGRMSPLERYQLMKYDLSVRPTLPLVLTMQTDDVDLLAAGNQPAGHAGVLFEWKPDGSLQFYDVNWPDVAQPAIYFDSGLGSSGGDFTSYHAPNGVVWQRFGSVGTPSLSPRASYFDLTDQALGRFRDEATIVLASPLEGQIVTTPTVSVAGNTKLGRLAGIDVYLYVNNSSRRDIKQGGQDFNFGEVGVLWGENHFVVLAGARYLNASLPPPSIDNWRGGTLLRTVCASTDGKLAWNPANKRCECPAGTTWNSSTCACPAGQTWNPNAQPPACEGPCDQAGSPCTVDVNGTRREFYVLLPANYDPSACPSHFVFYTGEAATILEAYRSSSPSSPCSSATCIIGQALPITSGGTDYSWADANGQDVAFVCGMVSWLETHYCVNRQNISWWASPDILEMAKLWASVVQRCLS
jgi:hypothetical protein